MVFLMDDKMRMQQIFIKNMCMQLFKDNNSTSTVPNLGTGTGTPIARGHENDPWL